MAGEGVGISLEYGLSNLNTNVETEGRSEGYRDLVKGVWMDVLCVIVFSHFLLAFTTSRQTNIGFWKKIFLFKETFVFKISIEIKV